MKFSKFSELVNRILSNNHSHRRDMDVTIVVHSHGSIGSTPSVEVQSIHAGFDWDSGKVLIFPAQPLTTLTPEQITDITDSVRKGQSRTHIRNIRSIKSSWKNYRLNLIPQNSALQSWRVIARRWWRRMSWLVKQFRHSAMLLATTLRLSVRRLGEMAFWLFWRP